MSDTFVRLISNPAQERVSSALPTSVYFRQSISQPWTLADLELAVPEHLDWGCNGAIGQASIIARSGMVWNNRYGWTLASPLSVGRWFTKIKIGDQATWFGQVDGASAEIIGHGSVNDSEVSIGALQRFYAFGPEQLLNNIFVTSSKYFDTAKLTNGITGEGASAPEVTPEGLTFNEGGLPNMTAFPWLGTYYFNPYRLLSRYWSTREIVRYLLREFPIPTIVYREIQRDIDRLPNFDRPVVPTHGRRVMEIISQLVNQRRGFCWWLQYIDDGTSQGKNDYYAFRTSTFNLVDTQLSSSNSAWAIPANTNRVRIDSRYDSSAEMILVDDESNTVDEVLVQGAKRTVTFTVSFTEDESDGIKDQRNGTKYWSDFDYEDYLTGDVLAAALSPHQRRQRDAVYREQKRLRNVLELYGLDLSKKFPPYSNSNYQGSWTPSTNTPTLTNGSGTPGHWYDVTDRGAWDFGNGVIRFSPGDAVIYDGSFWGKGSIPDLGNAISPFNLRILPSLPLVEGADYSGNKVSQGLVVYPEKLIPRQVFVIIDIRNSLGEDSKFLPIESIGRLGTDPAIAKGFPDYKWSANVDVVEGTPTFRVRVDGAPKWIMAKNPPVALAPHNKPKPELDWRKMKATVCLEDDRRVEFRYPPGGSQPKSFSSSFTNSFQKLTGGEFTNSFSSSFAKSSGSTKGRQLVVNVGDGYRSDYLVPGTIVDVDGIGKLVRSDGGWLQDDTSTLEVVARAAYDFYSKTRKEMQLTCDVNQGLISALSIGALVTQVAVGRLNPAFDEQEIIQENVWRSVNSVVTHVSLQFPWAISDDIPPAIGQPRMMVTTSTGVFDAEDFLEMARRGGRK